MRLLNLFPLFCLSVQQLLSFSLSILKLQLNDPILSHFSLYIFAFLFASFPMFLKDFNEIVDVLLSILAV
jgi:hypothetical protein